MMNFFKIGLPWAISLGVVFYIGLELGTQDKNHADLISPEIKNSSQSATHSSQKKETEQSTKSIPRSFSTDSLSQDSISVTYSPPLPPNLRRIMEDGSMVERMGAYMDALRGMDINTVSEVVDAFEALPTGYGRHLEMKLLMRSWANLDPQGALNYAQNSLDEKSERRFAMSEVLAGWAVNNSDAAIAWVERYNLENPDSKQSVSLLVGLVKGIAENDLESANLFSQNLQDSSAKWQATTFLAQEYAKLGTENAIKWAENFPENDERMRATIFGHLGSKLALNDIDGVARWAESLPTDKASEQVLNNLLSQWSAKKPQEAANWASQIQNPDKRTQAMKLLTTKWSLRDPIATASWLNQFPPSAELDPVVGEFVNRISTRDPEGAMGWATSIVDADRKEKAINQVLRVWERNDPSKAKEWRANNK